MRQYGLKQDPGLTAGVSPLRELPFRSAPEQRQQQDDRQRDSDEPKQRTFSKSHGFLRGFDRINARGGGRFPGCDKTEAAVKPGTAFA